MIYKSGGLSYQSALTRVKSDGRFVLDGDCFTGLGFDTSGHVVLHVSPRTMGQMEADPLLKRKITCEATKILKLSKILQGKKNSAKNIDMKGSMCLRFKDCIMRVHSILVSYFCCCKTTASEDS